MNYYEISCNTLAIIPENEKKCIVYEKDKNIEIYAKSTKIIDNSCKFFGSSHIGRSEGTKNLINISHKAPIIIEETRQIIFFPTTSPRLYNCAWINLNNIKRYYKLENYTIIEFYCGKKIKLLCSYSVIDNQVLRSSRLKQVLNERINII